MTSLIDGSSGFGAGGRSQAERRAVLAELRKQLPSGGPILERGGSPTARKIAVAEEFLLAMFNGIDARANMLKAHPAFAGRGLNYVGTWCKKIGLQWTKNTYPANGVNILKLCFELNELAPDALERVAARILMSADELIDYANRRHQDELDELTGESFESLDEFTDLPEDFRLGGNIDERSVQSQIEEMLRPFKGPQIWDAESSKVVQSDDINSETMTLDDFLTRPDAPQTVEDHGGDLEMQEFRAILKSLDSLQETGADSDNIRQTAPQASESFGESPSLPDSVSEQSPE